MKAVKKIRLPYLIKLLALNGLLVLGMSCGGGDDKDITPDVPPASKTDTIPVKKPETPKEPEKPVTPPKTYKITRLPFSYYLAKRATVENVQAAFAAGADSVYLESQNDFTELKDGIMKVYAKIAGELASVKPDRTRGGGQIRCAAIRFADSTYLAGLGFKVYTDHVYDY
jgi:hypothetical protein